MSATIARFYDGPKHRPWLCRLGLHAPEVAKDTGFTRYMRCRRCGERRVTQGTGGAQPIDWGWVMTGRWSAFPPPRPTPRIKVQGGYQPDIPPTDWAKLKPTPGTGARPPANPRLKDRG